MAYNTPAFLFAAFGAWYAGATLVPVNHKLRTAEVARQLRHCGARLGVVDAETGPRATSADTAMPSPVSHPDAGDARPHPPWGETVVAVVVPPAGAEVDRAGLRAWLGPPAVRVRG